MELKKIQKIIYKYLINQASSSELDDLELWVNKADNEKIFFDYVKTNYLTDYNLKKFNPNHTKESLNKLILKEKKVIRIKRLQKITKYAAAVIIISLLLNYHLKGGFINEDSGSATHEITNTVIEPGTDKAILTLEDGAKVALENDTPFQTTNAKSTGKEIIYRNNKRAKKVTYNYLTIPRGGQFFVKLSDGTEVWLNSETQLKYPVSFIEGKTRQVELIYGEAYFDVSSSVKNKGANFVVINKNQEIKVLGTQFNIKAYSDETNIYTTLVEGKVEVDIEDKNETLIPNQRLNLDLKTSNTIIKTVDVYNEVSWKEGVFSFEEKTLKEIMKVLSRWYDVEIIFERQEIEDEEFVGILRKNQNLEEILTGIKNFGVIKNFNITNDKKITLE